MRGLILAAGRGSRLQQKTDDRPKCLVELAGHPLLRWQLAALRRAGVEKIMVVRGYRSEMITGNFEVRNNENWQGTNMVGSLMCAKEWLLEEECVVSYSDIVYPSEAVVRLMVSTGDLALLYDVNWLDLWSRRFEDPLSDAESFSLDERGFIRDIGRKCVSLEEIHGQYMGLLKFSPSSVAWMEELLAEEEGLLERLDMTGLVSRLVRAGRPFEGVAWDGPWCEVDDADDLKVAAEMVASGKFDPATLDGI